MSFYETLLKYKDIGTVFMHVTSRDVEKAISSDRPDLNDFLALLSPSAEAYLEEMAQKSRDITLKYFGRTIQLYTPLYLSNYCENRCAYCGFNADNDIERKILSLEDVEKEAKSIADSGLMHILVLTGDSRDKSPLSYVKDCVRILKKYFSLISIEIYALSEAEYTELVHEGVDGLTIYQETYDEEIYKTMHPSGPKRDYAFRLDAPERGARGGMRSVNIGTLLGLNDWRKETFWLGLHANYLQNKFTDVEIGASFPRLRPHEGSFKAPFVVNDKAMVQIITALRIFLPRLGITISTREDAILRENLIPLGVTRISAGSSTYVGGHTFAKSQNGDIPQFEISDTRSVTDIMTMLNRKGYQPVLKDWMHI